MELTIKQISDIFNIEPINPDYQKVVKCVKIDSRLEQNSSLFVAIKGENFDGHDYVLQASEKGATAFLVSHEAVKQDKFPFYFKNIFVVKDTIKAMQILAKAYLEIIKSKTIAITGSVGKTTTKEMLAFVLADAANIVATKGNLNNHIGVPLSIFEVDKNTDFCILELGISNFGEMTLLSNIVNPDIGVILNIGKAHLQNLKDENGVLEAKWEMVQNIKPAGTLILNGDDELLEKKITLDKNISEHKISVKTFGAKFDNDIVGEILDIQDSKQKIKIFDENLEINVLGKAGFYSALAVYSVCMVLGFSKEYIFKKIAEFENHSKMRQNFEELNGIFIFNDAYNANPNSMAEALRVFDKINKKHSKFVVLGDMLELGESSEYEHRNIGNIINDELADIDQVICFGKESFFIIAELTKLNYSKKYFWSKEKSDVIAYLQSNVKKGDFVFLKASRGMKLEEVLNGFKK